MKEHCREVPVYRPTGAVVHTRKKLVKHDVTKEVPVYKWTVETICDSCAQKCATAENGKSRASVEAAAMAAAKAAETPSRDSHSDPDSGERMVATNGRPAGSVTRSSWLGAILGKE
jgi:hypothetical protein